MDGAKPELSGTESGGTARRLASQLVPPSGRPPYLVVASVVEDIANGIADLKADSAAAPEGFAAGIDAAARYVRDRASALREMVDQPPAASD